MLNILNKDVLSIVVDCLDCNINYGLDNSHKLLNLNVVFLKKTNKYLYAIIEEYYKKKYNYTNIYFINSLITDYYAYITNIIYFNEIIKIGNINMFLEIPICNSHNQYCNIVNNICKNGHVHIFEWLQNTRCELKYYDLAITLASENCHILILEWLKNSGFDFKFEYIIYSINIACRNGHIKVLDWFKNSGFEFRHDIDAINFASANGHIAVLDWFKNSGFEFKYTNDAINNASKNGYIDILVWFYNSGFEFKYDNNAITNASENGHVNILEWIKNFEFEFEFKYNRYAINGHIPILEWFDI